MTPTPERIELLADLDHPAVKSSLSFLRERFGRAKCDSDGVAGCVRCNTMFLVNTIDRLRARATTKEG